MRVQVIHCERLIFSGSVEKLDGVKLERQPAAFPSRAGATKGNRPPQSSTSQRSFFICSHRTRRRVACAQNAPTVRGLR